MKIAIGFPPLQGKGTPLLAQNRQFQWFKEPTYIYPVVPAAAATLLARDGHHVTWADGIAGEQTFPQWLDALRQAPPDLIAMETKTPVVKSHWGILSQLKEALPDVKVALMGDHVTALPEESFENSPVDYVLTGGDYDFLLVNLARHLEGGEPLEPGIWHRDGEGKVANTGPFQLHHDLSSLPLIDRDLTQWQLYSERNGNYCVLPGTYTMAGRDCWYHRCSFCSWTTLYPRYRVRRPESLLDEVGHLIERYKVKEIMDDTGSFPTGQWLRRFCQGMIERGYHKEVILDCNMRFGALDDEEYRLMKKAGFRLLLFGLESANQKTLDRLDKGLTVSQIEESCKAARRAGLEPHITIMFGYPWETREEAQKTLELGKYLLKKGFAQTAQATVAIPYPGTPLFRECQEQGLLKTLDWERYDMSEPIMVTPMEDEAVRALVAGIYKVALEPEFVIRRLAGIRQPRDVSFLWRSGKKVLGHIRNFSSKAR